MKEIVDYYAILEVSYYATADEIKEAYRKKVKETHPDQTGGDTEQFKLIKEANDVLCNDEKRKRYDDVLFKASKFNVVVSVPKKVKDDLPPKLKKVEKTEKKPIGWKITSIIALLLSILLLGFVIYLNNQYQIVNVEKSNLGSKLTSIVGENQDLENDNILLDSHLTEMLDKNQVLVEEVESLKNEVLTLEKIIENTPIQVSSTPSSTYPEEDVNLDYVTLGSTEAQVREILGTPNKILLATWYYDNNATVTFNYFEKTVTGWNNESGTLKVK